MAKRGEARQGEKKPRKPRKDDLTFACYLILEDGTTLPWEETTEEQRNRFRENAIKRLSQVMSDYYTQHPDEYARLPDLSEEVRIDG